MHIKSRQFRLSVNGSHLRLPGQSLIGRILTRALAVTLVVGAFVVSAFVFAVVAAGMVLLHGYLWWKTRELRQYLQAEEQGGRVIEGEVIRDRSPH